MKTYKAFSIAFSCFSFLWRVMLTGLLWFFMSCSLNWQHQLCKNPRPNPDIKTLFTDHSCAAPTNGARAPPPANGPLVGPIPKTAGFPPMGAHAVRITAIVELTFISSYHLPYSQSCSRFNLWFHHLQMQLLVGWQIPIPPYHILLLHKGRPVLFSHQTQVS